MPVELANLHKQKALIEDLYGLIERDLGLSRKDIDALGPLLEMKSLGWTDNVPSPVYSQMHGASLRLLSIPICTQVFLTGPGGLSEVLAVANLPVGSFGEDPDEWLPMILDRAIPVEDQE